MNRRGIGSGRQLATRMRRAPSTVAEWLKRPDWPFGPPPWDDATIAKVEKWASEALQPSRGSPELRAARVKLLAEQLRLLSLQNGIAAGLYVDGPEFERLVATAIVRCKHDLMDLGWFIASVPGEDRRQRLTERLKWTSGRFRSDAYAATRQAAATNDDRHDDEDEDGPAAEAQGEGGAGQGGAGEAGPPAAGKESRAEGAGA